MSLGKPRASPDPKVVLCGQSPVLSLVFGPPDVYKENPCLLSGHENGRVIHWDLSTQRATATFHQHSQSVIWLAWPLPHLFLSQGREGLVRVWCRSGQSAWSNFGELPSADLIFCDCDVLQQDDRLLLVVPSIQMSQVDVHIFKRSDLTPPLDTTSQLAPRSSLSHTVRPKVDETYGMCMRLRAYATSNREPRLLVAYESGALTLWNLQTGDLLSEVKAHTDTIMAMDCWANHHTGVINCLTGTGDDVIKSWHIQTDVLEEGGSVPITNPGVSALSTRGDGRLFASGGWDHRVRIFSLRKLNPLAVLNYHTGNVYCVTFAPDNTLASGAKDGYIVLWDIYRT